MRSCSLVLLAVATCGSLFPSVGDCAKILLLPGPHYSHVNFFSTMGEALKDNGHEVYVLTIPKYQKNVEKHGLLPFILHSEKDEDFHAKLGPHIQKLTKGEISITEIFQLVLPIMSEFCKSVGHNKQLMDQVQNTGFDLVINDATMFYVCLYTIPYRFGLKYMSLSAMHDPWTHGVTGLPSIEPSQLNQFSNEMSFLERAANVMPFLLFSTNPMSFLYSQEHMEEFVPHKEYKSLKQLVVESEMILITHDILCAGYPRVSAPNYQYIGGVSAMPAKALPKDLQEFADGAEHGLIILSFGSVDVLQSLWKEYKGMMMEVFASLPQRAIVQYGLDDLDDSPKNVRLVKWLPQNDLLGHSNTKVFITHGGTNGQLEAVYHGVPVLTMPFTGDQQYNAIQAKSKGFGLVLDRLTLSQTSIYNALTEILNNNTYSENIKKCSAITRSMPSSQEMAVFWVNHILRFGGDHLRSPTRNMPLYKVLMLDVVAVFAVLLILFVVIVVFLCRCTCRLLCKGKMNKRKTE